MSYKRGTEANGAAHGEGTMGTEVNGLYFSVHCSQRYGQAIGKIIEAGKLNLEGYDEFLGLTEKALREILEFVS